MTKQELSQLAYLTREAQLMRKQLNQLENYLAGTRNTLPEIPHLSYLTSRDDRAHVEEAAERIRAALSQNAVSCAAEYERLTNYILSIDDSFIRQILFLRYISCKTWQQVAFAVGEYDEQYPRKRHDRFLASEAKKRGKEKIA